MCDQPRPPQHRSSSIASTATSTSDDSTNTSHPTDGSRTSIDSTHPPAVPISVPISPLSKRRQKIFLPRSPARQQSLHEAEAYREQKKAERDRRISARGQAYKEQLSLEQDSMELQRLLLLKLAAVENKAALSPLGGVNEGELRRQRREHVEALRTSLRIPC
jgi:hypothetical protein